MSFDIQIAGATIGFPCEPEETILDAAERAGFALPYSCRKGACETCRADLIAGTVQLGRTRAANGPCPDILLCTARPASPVKIAPQWIERRTSPERHRLFASVHRIVRPSADVSILNLRFPLGKRVPFQAGQHVSLLFDDEISRNYSLANSPHESDQAQLHIRHLPGGYFSAGRLAELQRGDRLELELPFGQFVLRKDSLAPVIMLATGTGFAPFKSMIDDLVRRNIERPVHLFWGGRVEADLYLSALVQRWAEQLPWFRFTGVLSRVGGPSVVASRVQHAALEHYPDMGNHEVYACGSSAMVEDARALLTREAALPAQAFHADAFVPASDPSEMKARYGRSAL